jgi:isoquinoline 1-oxidoreductase
VAACVEVEVDPRTSTPKLLEICEAYECGAVVNPAGLRAQVEGAIIMGLGAALREEVLFDDGKLKNARFSGYRVPRFRDMPKIELVLVDKRSADPVGAGETPIIAVAPAMANAIFVATGQRVRSLPLRLKTVNPVAERPSV